MLKKRSMVILALLIILSLILPQDYAQAASNTKKKVLAKTVSITNPGTATLTIAKGRTKKLSVKVAPATASGKVTWKSSNPSVVSVTGSGTMKGVKKGTAKVTVTAADGSKVKDTLTVTVGTPVTGITVSKTKLTLTAGKTSTVKAAVKPGAASNKKLSYQTSDKKIATVSQNGKITAVSKGKATITVTARDGSGKKAKVYVTVNGVKISRTLTEKDVVGGSITVRNKTYDILTVDNSVGDAKILLDKVTVKSELRMEADAGYTVTAKDSKINKVAALEEETAELTAFALEEETEAAKPVPSFVAETGTLVVTIDAGGNVSVKQDSNASIGKITVNRKIDGNIELNLDGFNGNLVVNTISNADIAISAKNCNIGETTIGGTSSGQKLSLSDTSAEGQASKIGKVKIATNAEFNLNVPADELTIDESVTKASLVVDKPVGSIINNGISTQLSVNSDVTKVISTGNELVMKIAAGSVIQSVEASGEASRINVALGSTIESIISKGSASEITGQGNVKEVSVEGNGTQVNTPGTIVKVGNNVTGTTTNGASVPAGAAVTNPGSNSNTAPGGSQGGSGSGSSGSGSSGGSGGGNGSAPETGTKIIISDPGEIWSGSNIQLKADLKNVTWSVYSYIGNSSGYATIDKDTGILHLVSTGTVRVVAASKSNPAVYGAVDVVIQGRKFVRCEAVEPITLDSDEGIIDINALQTSGKLPDHVNLVYETGKGNETETITANLKITSWYGDYKGNVTGNYIISHYISVPSGYEQPEDVAAEVIVKVNTPQTDNRKVVEAYSTPEPLILQEDEKLVKFGDVFSKYAGKIPFTVQCEDGTTLDIFAEGYYSEDGNQFNGAVPGTYTVRLSADLPDGYLYRYVNLSTNSVYWDDTYNMEIPLEIVVQTPQTPQGNSGGVIPPDTTQPKFEPVRAKAVIDEVKLNQVPAEMTSGEIVDLNQYLEVLTSSELSSDKRVIWSYDGYMYSDIISNSGILLVNLDGTHTITAKSVIDGTKTASATIQVVNKKEIVSYEPLNDLIISEDLHIRDFKSLYNGIKKQLPTSVTAVTSAGEKLTLSIWNWSDTGEQGNTMVLEPNLQIPFGYDISYDYPRLTVHFTEPQTDNRIKVVTGSAIDAVVTLNEDKYATNLYQLVDALYKDSSKNCYVDINAELEDGSVIPLKGKIESYNIRSMDIANKLYDGSTGNYIVTLDISLPDGYQYILGIPGLFYDCEIEQQVTVNIDQTPLYESLWVTQKPKLSYMAGEKLDLTDILVMVRDTTHMETDTGVIIGYGDFAAYNLELRLDYEYGSAFSIDTPLTADMDGRNIFIFNTVNESSAFFGPLSVIQ